MSLSERPFLYNIMGGALKIWFSSGCCCIRYHFLVRISVRFETAGGIVLRRVRFFSLFFSLEEGLCPFWKFHCCEFAVNKVLQITAFHKVFFKCGYVFFKCFV